MTLLGECHEMWGIRVLAYCLMDNHYHLLIQTPQGNLSRVMRHLDGIYTQRYNRSHGRDGPLFRGRYKAIVVDGDDYLLAVARYIHHNPVEGGIAKTVEDYSWSSYGKYLQAIRGKKTEPWLDVKPLLGYFSGGKRKGEQFQSFMKSGLGEVERAFYERKIWAPLFGSNDFIEKIKKKLKGSRGDHQEVTEGKPYLKIMFETCQQAVLEEYGKKPGELLHSIRGVRNEARAMAMVICRRMGGMKQGEIAKRFGVGGYSTVSKVIWNMMKEIEKGGAIAKRYESIRRRIQNKQP